MRSFRSLQSTYAFDDVFVRETDGVWRFGDVFTSEDGRPTPHDLRNILGWLFRSPEARKKSFTVGHLGLPYRHFTGRRIQGDIKLEFTGQSHVMAPNCFEPSVTPRAVAVAIAIELAFGKDPFETKEAVALLQRTFFAMGKDGWQDGDDPYCFVRSPDFYDREIYRRRAAHMGTTHKLNIAHESGLLEKLGWGKWRLK